MTRRRKILDSFVFLWCQHQKVSNLFSLLFFFTPSLNRLNETKDYRISNSFLKNVRRMMDGGTKMDLTTKYKTRWCCWRLWIQRYICVTVLEKKRNRKKKQDAQKQTMIFSSKDVNSINIQPQDVSFWSRVYLMNIVFGIQKSLYNHFHNKI